MKNFKNLKIWQKGFQIAINAIELVKSFPNEARFGISQQITRAAVSITSNIAEGSSRGSIKDHSRFIEISLGSAFELESELQIAKECKYGNPELIIKILNDIDEEQKMLMSFINTLQRAVINKP